MLFAAEAFDWNTLAQQCVNGLTFGAMIALIALGYTMVYGIVELINFAHGDLFMLGTFLALTVVGWFGLAAADGSAPGAGKVALAVGTCFLVVPVFCAVLNRLVDRVVYRPLRTAPKLAPLVSAIGVSFVFMNVGLFWGGPQDVNFPNLLPATDLAGGFEVAGTPIDVTVTAKDLLVIGVTIPLMAALTLFVKYAPLGKAMRATAQNPTAARLMGIDVDRVIGATFVIGGGLAGFGSVVYALYVNTVSFQMGFQNGLYAFTAAVLGGIGNIPGAVLGALVIGLVRTFGSAYVGETWTSALVFAVLIVILVFRPAGLLGSRTPEKV
jgi:branched-chain amino acid transport system permease protein